MRTVYYLFLTGLAGWAVTGCVVRGRVYAPPPPAVAVSVNPAPPAVEPASGAEVAAQPPPPPQTEVLVAPPGPDYGWVAGYWNWNGVRWVWFPGRYVVRPWHGAVWVGGYWRHYHGHLAWTRGHWR